MIYKNGLWLPDKKQDSFARPAEHTLPIRVFDEWGLTPHDHELIQAMLEYPPDTKFRAEDTVYLTRCPNYMKMRRETVPRMWKIVFIVSTWQYELNALRAHASHNGEDMTLDRAVAVMEAQGGITEWQYRTPRIYAHAFPHGMYPDTTMWFLESNFTKTVVPDPNQEWEMILDAAGAPFAGWGKDAEATPFSFDFAPDHYSDGSSIGVPFAHEEAAFHTLARFQGFEEVMCRPVNPWDIGDPVALDPQHDLLLEAT